MKPVFTLRSYDASDADALEAICRAAINRLGPRGYRPEQVSAWLSIAPGAADLHRFYCDGRYTLVAAGPDDRPIGFSDLAGNGHIRFLYVDPDHAGRGVGSALVSGLLGQAHKSGLARVYSNASELARPVFERAGFQCIARQEHEIAGSTIHNFRVRLELPAKDAT